VNHSLHNTPLGKLLGIAIFLGVIALYIFWPHHMPPPNEKNRLWHPEDGYSIILPAGWEPSHELEETTRSSTNRGWIRGDDRVTRFHPPSLLVTCVKDPDKMNVSPEIHFSPGTFHGLPAKIANQQLRKDWIYRIVFKDRDRWFDLWLTIPHYEDVPNSSWWPYVDSYRYEPERAKKLAATSAPVSNLKFTTELPATAPAQ
jgi:hypothetical protein